MSLVFRTLLLLSVDFYVGENVQERPSVFRAAIYAMGVLESFLYMTVVVHYVEYL